MAHSIPRRPPGESEPTPTHATGAARAPADDAALYKTLFEQSPVSIIIYSPDGRPIMANPASFALWNITPQAWAGLQAEYNILQDPQLEKVGLRPYLKAAFGGTAARVPAVPYEMTYLNDNQVSAIEPKVKWIRGYIYPVLDKKSSIREVVMVQEDITDQKLAEEELRLSEERFRELAENIREVFWLFDWQEQRVLYVSPAYETVWGRSIQELYERYEEWGESIHPEDLEHANESFQRIVETGGGEEREYRIVRPDGEVRWLSDRGFAITDDKGQVVRIAGIAEDITYRKKTEQSLNRRLAFEATIAEISTRFVGVNELQTSITKSMAAIGRMSQASRAYLFLFRPDGQVMDNTHEWCASGVPPQMEYLQALHLADFPWAMPKLQAGEVVPVDDVQQLPVQARALQESLESQGIKSCLLMPVWIAGQVEGFMGLDNTRLPQAWDPEDVSLLRVCSEIIGNALTRRKVEESERAARELTEVLRQAGIALTSQLDLDQVLDRLLVYLKKVIPYDSAAVLLLEGDRLRLKAARGVPGFDQDGDQTYSAENALFQEMVDTNQPVILFDVQKDPRFERWGELDYVRGWMGIPLCGRQGVMGYMTVDSRQVGAYGKADAALAQTFASQAAIAVENARLFEEVQRLATLDSLTGLSNRRYFFELAEREFVQAQRHDRPLSVIMLDIDRFKRVNDSFGHAVGDRVLAEVAHRLRQEVRVTDLIGRYGGEEFAILLPESESRQASEVAERVRAGIAAQGFQTGNGPVAITASLGVAARTGETASLRALLDQADQALMAAKAAGRDQVMAWR